MSNKVTIYTMNDCPYCAELKELLENENIEYRNVDINLPENKEEFENILNASNADEVPILRIDKQLFVPNVSFKSIKEACYLVKKILSESDTSSK